jgi:acyl carrier protein
MTRDEIYEEIVQILTDSFELEQGDIKPESTLYEELGLDSIDAVDIFVQLRDITGRRPDPQEAKQVSTVGGLVDFVIKELEHAERGDPEPQTQMPDQANRSANG